jgi:hypothetical protein
MNSLLRLREDMKAIRFFLNSPDAEREHREEGITLCRQTLDRYRVLDAPSWLGGIYPRPTSRGRLLSARHRDAPDVPGCPLHFPIEVHAHEPETVYVIPMNPMLHVPIEGGCEWHKGESWRSH